MTVCIYKYIHTIALYYLLALIDGSEFKTASDIPDGGKDSAVDYCQALDWTDIICTTRPHEISTRVTDEPTPHSKTKN